ncbi:MAG: C40 family peptidase [Flavobacteriia bacterium]|nr:C40 family peptidase [Flavobacteriia bacterium]
MKSITKAYRFFLLLAVIVLPAFSFAQVEEDSLDVEVSDTATISGAELLMPVFDSVRPKNSEQVDEILNFAKRFLGTPYHYAGSTPSGFDCSGFIYYVMGNFGVELTRSSYGLAEFGETVRLADIRPGDLMFFKGRNANSTKVGHVALVVEVTPDAIRFIHASTSRGVVIDNFKSSKYYIPRFIKAKRLDYGVSE